ncbi:MAG: hypothetical protein AAB915_00380 [Patescibacteria group bacterium]
MDGIKVPRSTLRGIVGTRFARTDARHSRAALNLFWLLGSEMKKQQLFHFSRPAPPIKIIIGLAALAVFFALELILAPWGVALLSRAPLASLAALWWMGRLAFVPRMAYAALAGFFLDATFAHPFGASIILFLLIAVLVEILHAVLSRHDSGAARSAYVAIILAVFFILLPVVENYL